MSTRPFAWFLLVLVTLSSTGCTGCVRRTVAADPPTTVLNDIGWAPDLAYSRMSTRYKLTHSEAAFKSAVLALPHVRDLELAVANDVTFSDDSHASVAGSFDTKSGQTIAFTGTVVDEPAGGGGFRCDSLTVAGATVR